MKQRIGAPAIYKAALLAALAFVIPQLQVFRPAGLMKAHSQDLANAILGSSSLLLPEAKDGSGPRVVVLLADEEALRLGGASWPPAEGFHAVTLRELAIYRPAAVFVDFLFMDRRDPEGARELKSALLAMADSKDATRVYLPAADRQSLQALELDPAERARIGLVGVRHTPDAADSITRQYPWFGGPATEPLPSAAVQVYCDLEGPAGLCTRLSERRFDDPPPTFDLMWNLRPEPLNMRWHPRDCRPDTEPGWLDMAKGRWRRSNGCPSVATIFVSDLIAGAAPGQTAMDTAELLDLLRGSIVLYGSAFRYAGDTITSGVVGEVPGVFYHAAALENLQAYGGEPKMRRAFHGGKLWRSLLEYVFLIGMALLFLHRQRLLARHSVAGRRPRSSVRASLLRELSGVPVPLVLAPVILLLLLIAQSQQLRIVTLMVLSLVTIATEVLRGSAGRARLISRRFAIYAGAVLVSLLAVFAYGWFSFHVLAEPPIDWLGLTGFITFGWFLAQGAVGPFLDDLWASREARMEKQSGVTA